MCCPSSYTVVQTEPISWPLGTATPYHTALILPDTWGKKENFRPRLKNTKELNSTLPSPGKIQLRVKKRLLSAIFQIEGVGLNVAWRTEPHTGTRRDGFRPSPITNSLCDLELSSPFLELGFHVRKAKPLITYLRTKVPGACPEAPARGKAPHWHKTDGTYWLPCHLSRVRIWGRGSGTLLGKWSEQ